MTEKALRGVRPWNLLPSCSLLLVFRNPLSLVKPGPNETYRHKTKEQIVGDTPRASSVLEEDQLFCAWLLQLFSFAFQKLPAGTLSSRQTAQQQQQQQSTTKKVTSCCILKRSWSFFLSLPFFVFLLSVCLSFSNNRSELSPSTRTYNWTTKQSKPSPREARKSPKSNDQDIKSCLITAVSVFSSSWHFNNRKINCKRSNKRRSYLETDNNTRVYKFSSATNVSSPFLFFFFFLLPSRTKFPICSQSSHQVSQALVSVPKFPPLPSDDPMLIGLCELYQKRMNDWQRGWIFINYHFYWPPWKFYKKLN